MKIIVALTHGIIRASTLTTSLEALCVACAGSARAVFFFAIESLREVTHILKVFQSASVRQGPEKALNLKDSVCMFVAVLMVFGVSVAVGCVVLGVILVLLWLSRQSLSWVLIPFPCVLPGSRVEFVSGALLLAALFSA